MLSAAKVRLSGENTKEIMKFLRIFKRKYHRVSFNGKLFLEKRKALRLFFAQKCCVFRYFVVPLHCWNGSRYRTCLISRRDNHTKIQYKCERTVCLMKSDGFYYCSKRNALRNKSYI